MTAQTSPTPDPESLAMLESLRRAVAGALERKRRLGQYAVVWDGQAPIAVGEDAPPELRSPGRETEG
ncbi:hypothetical protein [Methylococcus sp. EFPC2]|uniref:hypothetical protein n=1 Tax=Methylococcus sp. EFPC2 TaxID=2812648 RepID=UPI0019687FF5|nr:hypothetical protein [Methylococcus sp. EFPC2]QSA96952.1 hypothetical protein JWZ97_17385 [Methylococcus sp. EFPC2]